MGIKPGPFIKKTLSDLVKARLDEQVVTRQDEMEFISKARWSRLMEREETPLEEKEPFTFRLEMFEGPLDLLLHLIQKNELDITNIPIALITDQYLEYLKLMKVLNLETAGEYLLMASTLLHIKSKMLLTKSSEEEEEEG